MEGADGEKNSNTRPAQSGMGVPPMSEEPLLIGVAADIRRLKRGESESESEGESDGVR
jgi:hypothetical protein